MVCENPYPCDMDLGLIEAIADRFRPPSVLRVRVEHSPGKCRKSGGKMCEYQIHW